MQQKPTRTVDWNQVRGRMEIAGERLNQRWAPSPEEKSEIFRARARLLAREPAQQLPDTIQRERFSLAGAGSLEVVEFLLAYEKYGIESSYIHEVYPLRELTPLPGTPPFVLGITNVRGQILSVIDLKRFFDLPEKGLTDLNKLIIVRTETMELGILADVVLGVQSISLEELQPSLATLTGIRAEYLRGLTKERLAVLDVGAILSDPRIVVADSSET